MVLVGARARRSRRRWLWPALGIALAVAAGGALAVEAAIAGDEGARRSLSELPPLTGSVRVTWQGPVTAVVSADARRALDSVSRGPVTTVVLLDPVRLDGQIVRPVAISPLRPWLVDRSTTALGPCRPRDCPVLLAGGGSARGVLSAAGVRLRVVGRDPLASDVPLGFLAEAEGSWPLLVTDDVRGLDELDGLSGLYRVHSWVAPLATAGLHSWNLAGVEKRLQLTQASLLRTSQQFSLDAPFSGIDAARADARSAPSRLGPVGGTAVVIVALFVLLAAAGLLPEQRAERERLQVAGATAVQEGVFVLGEAALLAAAGVLAGGAVSVLVATGLAVAAGDPPLAVLEHSVLTPAGVTAFAGCWLACTALISATLFARSRLLLNVVGIAGALVLIAGFTLARSGLGSAALAPLYCLAAGAVVFRGSVAAFTCIERLARSGPAPVRLAILGLARSPGLPAFAVAFLAVSLGLAGFALSYRATLARGAADQAAARVPLDALISPGASFKTPLRSRAARPLACAWRWHRPARSRHLCDVCVRGQLRHRAGARCSGQRLGADSWLAAQRRAGAAAGSGPAAAVPGADSHAGPAAAERYRSDSDLGKIASDPGHCGRAAARP